MIIKELLLKLTYPTGGYSYVTWMHDKKCDVIIVTEPIHNTGMSVTNRPEYCLHYICKFFSLEHDDIATNKLFMVEHYEGQGEYDRVILGSPQWIVEDPVQWHRLETQGTDVAKQAPSVFEEIKMAQLARQLS